MKGKSVSEALNGLPEEMVAEAMEQAGQSRRFSWLRLAACLAVIVGLFFGLQWNPDGIVTAPGLLTVTVYAKQSEGYVVTEHRGGIDAAYSYENECVINGEEMDPIGISVYLEMFTEEFPVDQIEYKVKADIGMFMDYSSGEYIKHLGTSFTKPNPSFVSWAPIYVTDDNPYADLIPEYDHVYVEIVVLCEDHIIGYTIMRFDRLYNEFGPRTKYNTCIVESVIFPKVKDAYQDISFELVDSLLEEKIAFDLRQFDH